MKLVVLGLSLSSSWGNGHATTFRALLMRVRRARARHPLPGARRALVCEPARPRRARLTAASPIYADLDDLAAWRPRDRARGRGDRRFLRVGGRRGCGRFVQRGGGRAPPLSTTSTRRSRSPSSRAATSSISRPAIIPGYDVYLSFTGGPTLDADRTATMARPRRARSTARSIADAVPRPPARPVRWDLSYLGTYSPDRQPTLEQQLLLAPGARAARSGASLSRARNIRTASPGPPMWSGSSICHQPNIPISTRRPE